MSNAELLTLAKRRWPTMLVRVAPDANGYWRWYGGCPGGYGVVGLGGKTSERVHRVAWAVANDRWPDDLHVHHDCRTKTCVNPRHLRALRQSDHARISATEDRTERHYSQRLKAKTRCANGHEYSPDNTYVRANGFRVCRLCQRDRKRRARAIARG